MSGIEVSFASLMAGLIFGGIGFWMIKEGKRRGELNIGFIGFALLVYTYFMPSPWLDWGVGIALCLLAWRIW
jgi:hypothetical protein